MCHTLRPDIYNFVVNKYKILKISHSYNEAVKSFIFYCCDFYLKVYLKQKHTFIKGIDYFYNTQWWQKINEALAFFFSIFSFPIATYKNSFIFFYVEKLFRIQNSTKWKANTNTYKIKHSLKSLLCSIVVRLVKLWIGYLFIYTNYLFFCYNFLYNLQCSTSRWLTHTTAMQIYTTILVYTAIDNLPSLSQTSKKWRRSLNSKTKTICELEQKNLPH